MTFRPRICRHCKHAYDVDEELFRLKDLYDDDRYKSYSAKWRLCADCFAKGFEVEANNV